MAAGCASHIKNLEKNSTSFKRTGGGIRLRGVLAVVVVDVVRRMIIDAHLKRHHEFCFPTQGASPSKPEGDTEELPSPSVD